ncbi:hypothetical protein KEM55_002801, partial [Ascosphaera atra]
HFNVTNQLQKVLPISIYLVGYIFGPLFLSPLTELYGRALVLKVSWLTFVCWSLGCALAPTWVGFLFFRFLSGVSASAPMSINGSVFADIYKSPITRGRAMSFFSAGTTMGPAIAPMISGFSGTVSWHWPFWILTIISGAVLTLVILFYPESFAPVLLARRAKKMRKEQNRDDIFAPLEVDSVSLKEMYSVTLTRPIVMLFKEPIVIITCWYMALVYAILYLFFESYPIIFQDVYHMRPGIDGLPYLALGLGACFNYVVMALYDKRLQQKMRKSPDGQLSPEDRRLGVAALGGPCIVLCLFWMGWTSRESINWMCPIIAGFPFGLGMSLIFTSLMTYQTDIYGIYSGSALAAAACLRSVTGALVPLAAHKMYGNLGIGWASSLLGFIVVGMLPIPYLLRYYAGNVRAISPFYKSLVAKSGTQEANEDTKKAEGEDVPD